MTTTITPALWPPANFDRPMVLLAQHIKQPLLQQLAQRLQDQLLVQHGQVMSQANDHQDQQLLRLLEATTITDAAILLVVTNEAQPQVLLTRRASHLSSHAGEVSLPGGKHEISDGSNVITALRETYEETALAPDQVRLIGQLPIQNSRRGISVRPLVGLIEPNPSLYPEAAEIARLFWGDLQRLLKQPTVDYHKRLRLQGKEATLISPSWQVDGETVWGMTGRVLASMMQLGFDRTVPWYYHMHPQEEMTPLASSSLY